MFPGGWAPTSSRLSLATAPGVPSELGAQTRPRGVDLLTSDRRLDDLSTSGGTGSHHWWHRAAAAAAAAPAEGRAERLPAIAPRSPTEPLNRAVTFSIARRSWDWVMLRCAAAVAGSVQIARVMYAAVAKQDLVRKRSAEGAAGSEPVSMFTPLIPRSAPVLSTPTVGRSTAWVDRLLFDGPPAAQRRAGRETADGDNPGREGWCTTSTRVDDDDWCDRPEPIPLSFEIRKRSNWQAGVGQPGAGAALAYERVMLKIRPRSARGRNASR